MAEKCLSSRFVKRVFSAAFSFEQIGAEFFILCFWQALRSIDLLFEDLVELHLSQKTRV